MAWAWVLLTAMVVTAPGPGAAVAPKPGPAKVWPRRVPWCDFAKHAQGLAAVPVAQDPVFRTPTPARLAAMEAILSTPRATPRATRAAALTALFQGDDGAALARVALSATDPKRLALALQAATPLATNHPRLAGLVTGQLAHPEPEVAEWTVHLLFQTGCDSPALYAMDGLQHASEPVRKATVGHVMDAATRHPDIGLMAKMSTWLENPTATRLEKVRTLRMLGDLGWLPATPTLQRLVGAKDPVVAAEALVALARVAPQTAAPWLKPWAKDRNPLRRAAAARAAADVFALDPDRGRQLLGPLLADKARVPMPDEGGATVGELARRALAYVEMN